MAARPRVLALFVSCACAGGVLALPAPSHAQFVTGNEASAQDHFQRGRSLFDARNYAQAVVEFRAALALVPSPNTRLYIGLSMRRLGGHVAEAYRELRLAEREANDRAAAEPRYARTAEIARGEAGALLGDVALVTVVMGEVPPGTVVRINGNPIAPDEWNTELAFEPRGLVVDASAPGRTPFHTTANVARGTVTRIRVRLDGGSVVPTLGPPNAAPSAGWDVNVQSSQPGASGAPSGLPGPSPLVPTGGAVFALGGVLALGGVVTGALALSGYGSLDRECRDMPRPCQAPDVEQRVQTGNTLVVLTNVGLISGGVLMGVGALLFGIGLASDASAGALPVLARRATPYLDIARGEAGVRGVF